MPFRNGLSRNPDSALGLRMGQTPLDQPFNRLPADAERIRRLCDCKGVVSMRSVFGHAHDLVWLDATYCSKVLRVCGTLGTVPATSCQPVAQGTGDWLPTPHAYAEACRREMRLDTQPSAADLLLAVTALPWVDVHLQRLSASVGGQDALLCPRAAGGFAIVVDPDTSPRDNGDGFIARRVAHELGHTYFYDEGLPRQRWCRWTPDEELWADAFAAILIS